MAGQTTSANGSDLLVYIDGTKIAYSTSHTLDITMETRDATTKDSSGWAEKKEGLRSWNVSCDALFVHDATYGIEDLFSLVENRTSVTLRMVTGSVSTPDLWFEGSAYVTSLSLNGGVEDTVSFSASFEGDGTLSAAGLT